MTKKRKLITKIMFDLMFVASIAFWSWGILSWIEIISKNLNYNPIYSKYNLIIMIYNLFMV